MAAPYTILLNEREYFARIMAGDEKAFTEIFYYYIDRMHSFVKRMTRSEEVAQEIIQDVFMTVWKRRDKLMEVENFSAYIFTIATNKTFNYLKAKARERKYFNTLDAETMYSSNNTMETIELRESQQLVHQLIDQLSPQKKIIFNLTREKGLSHEEIAKQLNISKNTVKNHLVETLRFLKAHIKKYKEVFLVILSIFFK